MRFAATFNNGTREIIFHMLTGLTRLIDVQVCAVVVNDMNGFELRAVTDTSASFGKVRSEEFMSFRVQSKSNNVIAVEVQIATLQAAFKDMNGDEIGLKLTKDSNGDIFLTLTARTVTQIVVTQDVPVLKVLNVNEMSRYKEPETNEVDATLLFPDVKAAKKVLDRMKQLDKFVQVKADQKHGQLVFRVDTEVVSTRTMFSNLALDASFQSVPEETGSQQQEQPHEFVVASLGAKELASITAGLGTFGKRINSTILAIVKGHLVCIHVNFDNESTLTFYLATSVVDDTDRPVLENTQLLRLETVKDDVDIPEPE